MNKHPMTRRIGRFSLAEKFVTLHPKSAMQVMAECVVVRCELRYDTMSFDYVAISPQFAEVPEDHAPPVYVAQMESINIGTEENPIIQHLFKTFENHKSEP
jgi:hypothetical protein